MAEFIRQIVIRPQMGEVRIYYTNTQTGRGRMERFYEAGEPKVDVVSSSRVEFSGYFHEGAVITLQTTDGNYQLQVGDDMSAAEVGSYLVSEINADQNPGEAALDVDVPIHAAIDVTGMSINNAGASISLMTRLANPALDELRKLIP